MKFSRRSVLFLVFSAFFASCIAQALGQALGQDLTPPKGELPDRAKSACKSLREAKRKQFEKTIDDIKDCESYSQDIAAQMEQAINEIGACYAAISQPYADYWIAAAKRLNSSPPCSPGIWRKYTFDPDSMTGRLVVKTAGLEGASVMLANRTDEQYFATLTAGSTGLTDNERKKYV